MGSGRDDRTVSKAAWHPRGVVVDRAVPPDPRYRRAMC
jgi:hypothetical protein